MIMSIIRLAIGMVPVSLLAVVVLRLQSVGAWPRARGVLRKPDADRAGRSGSSCPGWCCGTGSAPRRSPGASCSCFLPLTCVYYPVAVLPAWLQTVAWALPPTYVFEGMRALLIDHTFRADLMIQALALNVGSLRAGGLRVPGAARLGPPQRLADADWRIIHHFGASLHSELDARVLGVDRHDEKATRYCSAKSRAGARPHANW